MDQYNFEVLSGLIGETITVSDEQGQTTHLTITSVTSGRASSNKWESFSVMYQGSENIIIPQGTFNCSHQAFGEIPLFFSPKSPTEYETVVTRSRKVE